MAIAGGVGGRGAAAVVEMIIRHQPRLRPGQRETHIRVNLSGGANAIPDPHFGDQSIEKIAITNAALPPDEHRRTRSGRDGIGPRRSPVEHAVDVKLLVFAIKSHRHMRPGVEGDSRSGVVPETARIKADLIPTAAPIVAELQNIIRGTVVAIAPRNNGLLAYPRNINPRFQGKRRAGRQACAGRHGNILAAPVDVEAVVECGLQ